MTYEFDLFENTIKGLLSPFSNENSEASNFNEALFQKHGACYNYVIASFKKTKGKLTLVEKRVVNSLDPSVQETLPGQLNLFRFDTAAYFANSLFSQLKVKKNNVISISQSKSAGLTEVYIKEFKDCHEIPIGEARYYYYNDLFNDEVARIEKKVKDHVFKCKNQEEIEHYIHKLQQALINICFQLIKFLNPKQFSDIYKPAIDFSDTDILNLIYSKLEGLLCFFEKNYFSFIDENIKAPYRSELVKIYCIDQKLEVVKSAIERSNISSQLLKIMYVPLQKLNSITLEKQITYKELIYFNSYLSAFHEEISQQNENINETEIIETLLQVNFNSLDFFNFVIERIKEERQNHHTDRDYVSYLYQRLKTINQLVSKLNITYSPDLPPIKLQIINWLEEEINYLSKKLLLDEGSKQPNLFNQVEKIKIQTGISVAQLALFHKLQTEVGIITHKNQRDIFRHIAESYSTSKVQDISPDSVGSKYYNVDNTTYEAVKTLVIQMLNNLNNIN